MLEVLLEVSVGVFVAFHCDLNDGCDGHDWGDFDEGAY